MWEPGLGSGETCDDSHDPRTENPRAGLGTSKLHPNDVNLCTLNRRFSNCQPEPRATVGVLTVPISGQYIRSLQVLKATESHLIPFVFTSIKELVQA